LVKNLFFQDLVLNGPGSCKNSRRPISLMMMWLS
jgi:hypothetical protein